MSRWVNPTGGLIWHARAWRSQARWRATTDTMQTWWLSESPRSDRLVIVGASAGWMISQSWLRQFKEIHTWDIDPWSRWLFGRLHGQALQAAGITWHHHTADPWDDDRAWQYAGTDTLYWFDNVLGQLRFIWPQDEAANRIGRLRTQLRGTRWGSVHDRYSGPLNGQLPLPHAWASMAGMDLDAPRSQAWLQEWGAQGSWLDHLTAGVFKPQTSVLNLAWAFKPDFGHWLEMGWQLP